MARFDWFFRKRLETGVIFLAFALIFFLLCSFNQPHPEIAARGVLIPAQIQNISVELRRKASDIYRVELLYRSQDGKTRTTVQRLVDYQFRSFNFKTGQTVLLRYVPGTDIVELAANAPVPAEKYLHYTFIAISSLFVLIALIAFFLPYKMNSE